MRIRGFIELAVTVALLMTIGHSSVAVGQDIGKPKIVTGTIALSDTVRFPPGYFWDSLRVKQNWPKLKRGLSEKDVIRLLGHPNGCGRSVGGELVVWLYGQKDVVFNSVTRKVAGWDEWTPKYRRGNAWR